MLQIPKWVYNLDNRFDHNRAAVTAYVAFLQWFRKKLLHDDTQRIAKGAAGCWPRPGDTTEQQICEAFLYVLRRVAKENLVNYNTNQCYHKLIRIVHLDQFAINTVGFRVYYALMMCSALISHCIAVVHGGEVMTAREMPGILITLFEANRNAWNYPPSDFEFAAAEIAQTHLGGGECLEQTLEGDCPSTKPGGDRCGG
jgi:hypothetical protein